MTFSKGGYIREKGDCCRFFRIEEVILDSGTYAVLLVTECKKGKNSWKELRKQVIQIPCTVRNQWRLYTPPQNQNASK